MKKTRKFISIIMCIAIALSVFTIATGLTIQKTVFDKDFVADYLITDELQEQCTEQLKLKFKALEKESNIPAKVFKKVLEDKPIDKAMKLNVENFFIDRNTSLNSEDMVDYFYKNCTQYLDENGIKYNEQNVRNAAVQATKLYSDSMGFNNVEHLKLYIDQTVVKIKHSMGIAFGYLFVACMLMYAMYSDPKQASKYIAQSIIASGFSGVVISLLSGVAGYGFDLPISPEIYMQSFNELMSKAYLILAVVSLMIMITGTVLAVVIDRLIIRDNNRRQSRFDKKIGNF